MSKRSRNDRSSEIDHPWPSKSPIKSAIKSPAELNLRTLSESEPSLGKPKSDRLPLITIGQVALFLHPVFRFPTFTSANIKTSDDPLLLANMIIPDSRSSYMDMNENDSMSTTIQFPPGILPDKVHQNPIEDALSGLETTPQLTSILTYLLDQSKEQERKFEEQERKFEEQERKFKEQERKTCQLERVVDNLQMAAPREDESHAIAASLRELLRHYNALNPDMRSDPRYEQLAESTRKLHEKVHRPSFRMLVFALRVSPNLQHHLTDDNLNWDQVSQIESTKVDNHLTQAWDTVFPFKFPDHHYFLNHPEFRSVFATTLNTYFNFKIAATRDLKDLPIMDEELTLFSETFIKPLSLRVRGVDAILIDVVARSKDDGYRYVELARVDKDMLASANSCWQAINQMAADRRRRFDQRGFKCDCHEPTCILIHPNYRTFPSEHSALTQWAIPDYLQYLWTYD
ncbi:hypothetical protein PV10_02907 [Exophiala mesophila]|uniref:Uncharacterized protein n=1 Tax=Exophiala mesophila TaxID=212818 RepID=A0A0D1X0D9_EXOME|nr:uncharacterized protein PV10_02907 [Exophiala mesophila]KIV95230.1 hypothetical protein PV10_02907 [Exophiala mesophila]